MSVDMRTQLVDAGLVLLERDGLQALSVRNLAAEVGTSTMAVYTHFGGMTGVLDAVASEVFARFAAALTEIPHTDDPVADFFSMGIAYHGFAMANPQRYQLIFGTSAPVSLTDYRTDLTVAESATDRADWGVSFDVLRNVVHRMIAAGRIRDDGERILAGRFWGITHGVVMLELAGFLGRDGHGLVQILTPLTVDVLVGLGDEREKANASLTSALNALAA
jgi:AcrR family transcriptional regulator